MPQSLEPIPSTIIDMWCRVGVAHMVELELVFVEQFHVALLSREQEERGASVPPQPARTSYLHGLMLSDTKTGL